MSEKSDYLRGAEVASLEKILKGKPAEYTTVTVEPIPIASNYLRGMINSKLREDQEGFIEAMIEQHNYHTKRARGQG